jgi:ABC-type lipoprotein release transport system permease subunit
MMVNWKFAWREARHRRSRVLCSPRALAVPIATAVSLMLWSSTCAADHVVKRPDGHTVFSLVRPVFSEQLVAEIRKLPEVQAVAPLMVRNTILYVDKDSKNRLVAFGIDPEFDQEVRNYDVTQGKMFDAKTGGVLLDENLATKAGIKLNTKIEFLTARGFIASTVIGFYKTKTTGTVAEGGVLLPLRAAQHFFKSRDEIDTAEIALKPGADRDAVQKVIRKILIDKTEFLQFPPEKMNEAPTQRVAPGASDDK